MAANNTTRDRKANTPKQAAARIRRLVREVDGLLDVLMADVRAWDGAGGDLLESLVLHHRAAKAAR
jgi:hypothetical protein